MARKTKRNKRKRSIRRKGGAATAFPLSYFDGKTPAACASAGRDLLPASGMGVRPGIGLRIGPSVGGGCGCTIPRRGGFYPSVMGSFAQSASKYIVPMSLYAGYKMLKKSQEKSAKRKTRRR